MRDGEKEKAMGRKVDDLIGELEALLRVFSANPRFAVGDITADSLTATIASLRAKSRELDDSKALATRLVNELDTGVAGGKQIQTRGLSGVRANFGPDSSEYEQAGGTRASERKKAGPKKKT